MKLSLQNSFHLLKASALYQKASASAMRHRINFWGRSSVKRVSPLVTVAGNDVMHFQQGGKSILRRLTFATLFMRTRNKMQKKNLTKKKIEMLY